MKTLANCSPTEFLRQTNKIRHECSGFLKKSGVLEIRKRQPELTGKETEEELKEKNMAQVKKNLDAMLDVLLDTNAEGAAEMLRLMCIFEPGEEETLTGMELLRVGMDVLSDKAVIDFLLFLMKSAQTISAVSQPA